MGSPSERLESTNTHRRPPGGQVISSRSPSMRTSSSRVSRLRLDRSPVAAVPDDHEPDEPGLEPCARADERDEVL